ncbi:MAG: hypothetical protein IT319_16355 [Anaerolineae bacterium]|nr:hypothetical protein [Anaerolineae bacterium]
MTGRNRKRHRSLLVLVYRWLLYLYPAEFRREYAGALEQLIRDLDRETRGWQARLALSLRIMVDIPWSALPLHLERLNAMKWWMMVALTAIAGFVIGCVDIRAGQIQVTLTVIMLTTLLIGFLAPKRAWLWAALALWFLAGGMLLSVTNAAQPYVPPYVVVALFLVVPAQISAYIGVTTRALVERHQAMKLS